MTVCNALLGFQTLTKQFPAVVHFSTVIEVLEVAACKQPFTSQERE